MIASGGVESFNHPLTVLNFNSADILKAVDHDKNSGLHRYYLRRLWYYHERCLPLHLVARGKQLSALFRSILVCYI